MKTHSILLSTVLMAAITPALAQTTSGMQAMPMDQNMPGMQQSETAKGTGVVEAIDIAKGTITLQHQAIPSIHWPAMTMTFKADPPSLLKNLKVGEKVNFTLHPNGANSWVTALAPVN